MLRRSFCCQHNKLTFSKSNWYNLALRAVLPEKKCLQRAIRVQGRATATLASALEDVQDKTTPSVPLPAPLEPLRLQSTIIVQNKNSVSHFRRCVGRKKACGQQCTRLVKVDPACPDIDYQLCIDHNPNYKKKLKRACQVRNTANAALASALEDVQDVPLQSTIIVQNKNSVSHFRRCVGRKKACGQQCTRLVKVDPACPDKGYQLCIDHNPNYIKKKVERAIQVQHGADANSASALEDAVQDEATPSIPSKIPLKSKCLQKTSKATIVVQNKSSVSHLERCRGYKRYSGQPCNRLVKVDPACSVNDRHFCFAHHPNREQRTNATGKKNQVSAALKEIIFNESASSLTKQNDMFRIYDCWQLWVEDRIEPKQKALIKRQMTLPLSGSDQPGYIYAYHLEDGPRVSQMEYAYFKIGRTADPHRRMYQVTHACNYIPKIIELIPSFPKAKNYETLGLTSTNLEIVAEKKKKTATTAPKCPMSHRVERLILLELASLHENAGFKCDECGSTHREWIRVDRRKHPDGKLMTDRQLWESDIRPIVLKWIQYGVLASALKGALLLQK